MTITSRTRAIVVAAALAGAASVVAAPAASAGPKLTPVVRPHVSSHCPDPVSFAADLRDAGFTAQAAHMAAILTARACE
jgi:hypothetical protein